MVGENEFICCVNHELSSSFCYFCYSQLVRHVRKAIFFPMQASSAM